MKTIRDRGMNPEGDAETGPEADRVIDDHGELLGAIADLDRD
jgi:hypothetical protein